MTDHRSDAFAREVERRAFQARVEVFVGSRDVGQTLTADSLKDGIALRPLLQAAQNLEAYADDAIAIVRDEYKPRLDCREGCSYCCRKPGVLVTIPELLRVVDHVQAAFDAGAIDRVRTRARGYVEHLAGRSFDAPTSESFPCPLLTDDGRCSVYDIRPLTCRGYNSTSVDACRRAHESTAVLVPIFAPIRDVTDGTTVGASKTLREAGVNGAVVDLGTALDIAFTRGDDFVQSVMAGGDDLQAAQNPSWADDLWNQVRETAREMGLEV